MLRVSDSERKLIPKKPGKVPILPSSEGMKEFSLPTITGPCEKSPRSFFKNWGTGPEWTGGARADEQTENRELR